MKRGWLALVMLAPMLAGCLGSGGASDDSSVAPAPYDPGYDASELEVTGVATHPLSIDAGDVTLAGILYEPLTTHSIDGEDPRWPVVVLIHSWGFPHQMYENAPISTEGQAGPPNTNLLQRFAEAGIMAVAYDARGWGQSTGQSTVVGQAEMRDLRAVIDHVNERYLSNGNIGVTGVSYGGLHAYRAWAEFDDVVTVVPHNADVDVFEALFPGGVPKLEWGAALTALAAPGTHVTGFPPDLSRWMETAITRQTEEDVDGLEREIDSRAILQSGVESTDKPIFVCQGFHDSLFTQAHLTWMNAPGFARAHYYQGGHNTLDDECWHKTVDWFSYFLAGIDTGVAQWPFLQTIDASSDSPVRSYSRELAFAIDQQQHFLREGQTVEYVDETRTFNIAQRGGANPIQEPSVVWESTGQSYQTVPEQFRQDPSALFFETPITSNTQTLLGAPAVDLVLANGTSPPFQVVGTLYLKHDGALQVLGRGANAPLGEGHLMDNSTRIEFPFVKADMAAGDQIVLKLASNDPNVFMPLLANYDAAFTGESHLWLPVFDPPGTSA